MSTELVETEEQPVREGLTAKQSAFVDAYVANGGQLKAAAVTAGYAEASAHVEANRLMKNPKVCKAVMEETALRMARDAPAALEAISGLFRGAKSELVKLQAAQDWLDRAGFKPIERKDVRLQGDLQVSIDLS